MHRGGQSEPQGNGERPPVARLSPAWWAFIRHCESMGHGEIERVKIQDGVPVLAEISRTKVRFGE